MNPTPERIEEIRQRVAEDWYRQNIAVDDADEAIRDLLAALASQPQAQGWEPIETAPKDGTRILALGSAGILIIAYDVSGNYRQPWRSRWLVVPYLDWLTYDPTHWIPLPPAPGDRQDGSR